VPQAPDPAGAAPESPVRRPELAATGGGAVLPTELAGRDWRPPGELAALAGLPPLTVLRRLGASPRGLTEDEAHDRLLSCGENTVPGTTPLRWPGRALRAARDPFVGVLLGLAAVSAVIGNLASVCLIGALAVVSCALRLRQEARSARAAAALQALAGTTATVSRRAAGGADPVLREVPVDQLVPGDIVQLSADGLVPADLRLLRADGLSIDQALLTGETAPAAKAAGGSWAAGSALPDCPWLCLAGSGVISGTGTGVLLATGPRSYLGTAQPGTGQPGTGQPGRPVPRPGTCFDRGVRAVSVWLIWFMLAAVGLVLATATAAGGDFPRVLVFAVAVAVGLTPEMLPVVVTTVLARGARGLAGLGVIVTRLAALHNLGAIDILCTDKTGTLTEGAPALDCCADVHGQPSDAVLRDACLTSYWAVEAPGGPACGPLDEVLLARAAGAGLVLDEGLTGIGLIPFDPARRRMSVVLRQWDRPGWHLVITKGAVPEVLACCDSVLTGDGVVPIGPGERQRLARLADGYAAGGAQVLGVASGERPARMGHGRPADGSRLTFSGFAVFRDRPRRSAATAIGRLAALGVQVKIITGDHPLAAAHICQQAGIDPGTIVTGDAIEPLTGGELAAVAAAGTVFARILPGQKARIVAALRAAGHPVGFLGDGVNDVPALAVADVGVSAESAAGAARAAAEVILARPDLTTVADAVLAGRRAFGNVITYLKIVISSNAGNVASMIAASVLLPFLPMLPIQVLVQNLCFDAAQLTLAFDRPDVPARAGPRTFDLPDLTRFVLCFGLVNALADLATFAILWRLGAGHDPAMFRAAWFTENLASQALAVVLLRSRTGPSPGNLPARPVLLAAIALSLTGLCLPLSPLASALGMRAPVAGYYPLLVAVLAGYGAAVLAVRSWYRGRYGHWL
jgi:Mg2+-importing ATPase